MFIYCLFKNYVLKPKIIKLSSLKILDVLRLLSLTYCTILNTWNSKFYNIFDEIIGLLFRFRQDKKEHINDITKYFKEKER